MLDTLECGIVLVGSEVKSLRNGKISLEESYARVKADEVWLIGCDIPEYTEANRYNHLPKRPRKLLLHRREIKRFAGLATQKGLTLVPLKIYFKEGRAKVLLGLCKGKQLHDKREAMKKNKPSAISASRWQNDGEEWINRRFSLPLKFDGQKRAV